METMLAPWLNVGRRLAGPFADNTSISAAAAKAAADAAATACGNASPSREVPSGLGFMRVSSDNRVYFWQISIKFSLKTLLL